MTMQHVTPPPPEPDVQAAKWSAIGRAIGWAAFLLALFLGLVIYLGWHMLQQTAPALMLFLELVFVVLAVGAVYGLYRYHKAWQEARLERYRANTARLAPDVQGNYEAIHDTVSGTILQATPGNYVQPVSETYAPHYAPALHAAYEYKDNSQRVLDEATDTPPFQAALAPTIEEVIRPLPRNGYHVGLGRSLTSGELLPIALEDSHILIIGATRKGKSSLAGAILEQVQRTHDPGVLQFALLDVEAKTSRLFQHSSHVACLPVGRRGKVPAIAHSAEDVGLWLRYLREEMDRRYHMSAQHTRQLPLILVYLEEFLTLRKRLSGHTREEALDNFTLLATQGLKERIALMVCAQVNYAEEELREAMAQFVGTNISFSVKPSAARSAGFVSSALLNRNFEAKIPGQYVVESTGLCDLGISPQYDLRQQLAMLDGLIATAPAAPATEAMPALTSAALPTEVPTSIAHPSAPAWQASYDQVWECYCEGVTSVEKIVERIWNVSKGGNEKYSRYRQIVQACLQEIRRAEQQTASEAEHAERRT